MAKSFDASLLSEDATRWVRVNVDDMEIEIRRMTPEAFNAFRRKMVSFGVLNKKDSEPNPGRFLDYMQALAKEFVTGWRGVAVDGVENPPYSAEKMGYFLTRSFAMQEALNGIITDEQAFFSRNGSGSPG